MSTFMCQNIYVSLSLRLPVGQPCIKLQNLSFHGQFKSEWPIVLFLFRQTSSSYKRVWWRGGAEGQRGEKGLLGGCGGGGTPV